MITRRGNAGKPYSDDFLNTLKDDLEQLAIDYKKAGGSDRRIETLKSAVIVILRIRLDNEAGEE